MADEKVVERIRHLMALARDQEGRPEGELAAEFAQQMMLEHAVRQADLETGAGGASEHLLAHDYDLSQRLNWKRYLLSYVAKFCGCKMTYYSSDSMTSLYGYESDVEVCIYLYEVISRQLEKQATKYYRDELKSEVDEGYMTRGEARRKRTSFLSSAVIAIKDRLSIIRDGVKSDEKGIILARDAKVDDFFKSSAGPTKPGAKFKYMHSQKGHNAGMSVEINPAIAGTGARKPKGLLN